MTTKQNLEASIGHALDCFRTPDGAASAYVLVTASVYLVGEWSNSYEPLLRGVFGVFGLYLALWFVRGALRFHIHATGDAPSDRPTGANGATLQHTVIGYLLPAVVALVAGFYLGSSYVATTPGAAATATANDHGLYAGVLAALAVGAAVLNAYEDYTGTSVQEWLDSRTEATEDDSA